MMLTDQQFDRTRRLALSLAGIELFERHRELLGRRSRRSGILDLDSLLSAAEEGETKASQQIVCLLTTKFTGFFRHPRQFEIATKHVVQVVGQRGRARLWSAGAATGEEPWSLAVALIRALGGDNPPVTVLATDVDACALQNASRGDYPESTLEVIEPVCRDRFFTASGSGARLSICDAARRLVEFRPLNLASPAWPVDGPFDVIFCRNVLMYLEVRHRVSALERMAALLRADGLLMLDPTEHLGRAEPLFSCRGDGIYVKNCPASDLVRTLK
jgi:chemotaxis protein methyltransferase CheR